VHFAAPSAGLGTTAGLDELLEPAHISFDTPVEDA
jgi:hypothetical protein